jgi:hypothetical protein
MLMRIGLVLVVVSSFGCRGGAAGPDATGGASGMAGSPSGAAGAPGGAGRGGAPAGAGGGGAGTLGGGLTGGAAGAAVTGVAGGVAGAGLTGVAGSGQSPDGGGSTFTAPVVFTPPSQTFQGTLQVSLSTMGDGEIRYTIDGTPPTASSMLYTGTPVSVTATTQVRAQTFMQGVPASVSTTGLYVARSFDMTLDLPIVIVDFYGRGKPSTTNRTAVDAAFMTFELAGGAASLTATPTLAARAGIHIRGQSSAMYAKPPYRIELHDGSDNDEDHPVLGMPAESDWVLNSPYPDKALIRNAFVYSLGRDMGMPAPRFAFAEVYLNYSARPVNASDYVGVYLMVETIKNQKDRLNLQQLKDKDISLPKLSGGYIFKFELLASEEPKLLCTGDTLTCWKDLELYDPLPVTPEQQAYITRYLQTFHDNLHTSGFADPTTGYPASIDPGSFVDQLIIHELTRNMDAYVRSQYFYKDRDAKVFAGPLWDYDLTMDVGGFFDNRNTQGWQYEQNAVRNGVDNDWFQRLMTDPAFVARVVTRWKTLRQGLLADAQIDARINKLTAGLANAAARNFQKWPILTTAMVSLFKTSTQSTWQAQVDNMRTWAKTRAAWLDTQWK